MALVDDLRLAAMNRHRVRLFGSASLIVYEVTPDAGETAAATFAIDWCGQRIRPTTVEAAKDSGEWQFQIDAASDWQTSQAFMKRIVALTIATRRWKVTKVEEPIGVSLVWKVRAQVQR